jgi:hypothetical protein
VTDDSGATRENITIWKGEKRQQLVAGKEFEPTPESGDERTTTLEVAELGKWKTKPGKYKWCVRAIDEAGNKRQDRVREPDDPQGRQRHGRAGHDGRGARQLRRRRDVDGGRDVDRGRRLVGRRGHHRRRVQRGRELDRLGGRGGAAREQGAVRKRFHRTCQEPLTSRTRRRSITTPRVCIDHEVTTLRHAADAVFFGEEDRDAALERARALLADTLAHDDRLGPDVAETITGLLDGVQPVLATA